MVSVSITLLLLTSLMLIVHLDMLVLISPIIHIHDMCVSQCWRCHRLSQWHCRTLTLTPSYAAQNQTQTQNQNRRGFMQVRPKPLLRGAVMSPVDLVVVQAHQLAQVCIDVRACVHDSAVPVDTTTISPFIPSFLSSCTCVCTAAH